MSTRVADAKQHARLIVINNPDTSNILAFVERDSVSFTSNEETAEFDAHSAVTIQTDRSTANPQFEFTGAVSESKDGMDELGLRDDANQGQYTYGDGRDFAELEIWIFEDDADVTADTPAQIDRVESCWVQFNDVDYSTDAVVMSFTIHVDDLGDVYFDWEEAV